MLSACKILTFPFDSVNVREQARNFQGNAVLEGDTHLTVPESEDDIGTYYPRQRMKMTMETIYVGIKPLSKLDHSSPISLIIFQ